LLRISTRLNKKAEWERGEEWSPSQPIDGRSLANELMPRRFHPQDICDAMDEADPQWNKKLA
jgi:hypothetical protein